MYALIDGTRFFANASILYRPEYTGVPVLVTAGQGISIAANRKCSELRIKKFVPIWQQIDKLRAHNGVVFRVNFDSIGHISRRVSDCLSLQMPGIRGMEYSVDESFFCLRPLHEIGVDLASYIENVRKIVYKETGVATGAGIGASLTLAKAASWCGKNISGYRGQCVLDNDRHIDEVLNKMPVSEVWQIGPRLTQHLKYEGITTALQLKNQDPKVYHKRYGITLANVINELNGIAVLNFDDVRSKKKQIWSTSSYRDRLRTTDSLSAELAHHTSEVMCKIRLQHSETLNLSVFVATSVHDKGIPFNQRVELSFKYGVSDTSFALKSVSDVIERLLPANLSIQPIYKVGVGAHQLIDNDHKQYELFNDFDNKEPLNCALDSINNRFGKGTLRFGSQSRLYKEQEGQIKFEVLEHYYTDFNQLINIKCS